MNKQEESWNMKQQHQSQQKYISSENSIQNIKLLNDDKKMFKFLIGWA